MDLTRVVRDEEITEDTQTESWHRVVWALSWRCLSTLEGQQVYYIELNRLVRLLHTAEQGDGLITQR